MKQWPSLLDKTLDTKWLWSIILLFFLTAGLILLFVAKGIGDDGDSAMHYQFARYAPAHHELFFHHWAKPLYVLLASPFAQFGILGIKVFNLLLSCLSVFITWRIAVTLHIKRSTLASLFLVLSPAFIALSLSGLTEPLFALTLAAAVLLYLKEKELLAMK